MFSKHESEVVCMRGYKVFNPDWTCRDFQYKVGESYEMNATPEVCERGFHFCEKASDCFEYYSFNPKNKVAEVEAYGDIETVGNKSSTNKIKIVREIPWDELLRIVNEGDNCTGLRNTGNCNTGNRNTGNRNTGDWNTGNRNTGDCNTGNRNTGNRNTGDWNTGDRNTGDWNRSSFNNGCFMTEEPKIMMFNKPTNWTYKNWRNSDACALLSSIPKRVVEWIYMEDMTDGEKKEYSTYETTGGYLKVLDKKDSAQKWWDGLSDAQKGIIKALPNFDADIFYECTGIKTTE